MSCLAPSIKVTFLSPIPLVLHIMMESWFLVLPFIALMCLLCLTHWLSSWPAACFVLVSPWLPCFGCPCFGVTKGVALSARSHLYLCLPARFWLLPVLSARCRSSRGPVDLSGAGTSVFPAAGVPIILTRTAVRIGWSKFFSRGLSCLSKCFGHTDPQPSWSEAAPGRSWEDRRQLTLLLLSLSVTRRRCHLAPLTSVAVRSSLPIFDVRIRCSPVRCWA